MQSAKRTKLHSDNQADMIQDAVDCFIEKSTHIFETLENFSHDTFNINQLIQVVALAEGNKFALLSISEVFFFSSFLRLVFTTVFLHCLKYISKSLFDGDIASIVEFLEIAIDYLSGTPEIKRPKGGQLGLMIRLYSIMRIEACASAKSSSHGVLSAKTVKSLACWAKISQMKSCLTALHQISEAMKDPCERIDMWSYLLFLFFYFKC